MDDDTTILHGPMPRRIGNYEIRGLLGAGGMGEVYRAFDTRLRREVAIKMLPRGVIADPRRLARFEREARALASINHQNIGAIYGLEEAGERERVIALVLELIDGDTLADRLTRSGALPLDEALRIANQIVDALDAAHEKGIVHRDLKPANIKLTPGGIVKVLDFGLAKTSPGAEDVTQTRSESTVEGIIVGTPAYMSPEQARGYNTDTRTDVWAFGCVLFEMLTGMRPFAGPTATDTIAAVIEREPDWSKLPASTPPSVRALLRSSLEKDPERRPRTAKQLRAGLADVAVPHPRSRVSRSRRVLRAVAALAVLAIGLVLWRLTTSPAPSVQTRSEIELPPGEPLQNGYPMAASPDGRYIAFSTNRDGRPALYLRALDADHAELVSNDNAGLPFFSPDSKWIGFFAGGKLQKRRVDGGTPVVLASASTPRGGSWADAGFIVFAAESREPLSRVSADGGPVTMLTTLDAARGETSHRTPEVLPGSRAVVMRVEGSGIDARVEAVEIESGRRHVLVDHANALQPHYAPSGHLLYLVGPTLTAIPFDAEHLEVTGAPAVVQQQVQTYAVMPNGSLIYAAGGTSAQRLEWIDRHGKATPLPLPPDRFQVPRLSPDGKRVVMGIDDRAGSGRSIWIYDIAADKLSRLTSEGTNLWPVWTADGTRVVYAKNNPITVYDIYERRADIGSDAEQLLVKPGTQIPRDISKDDLLVYGDGEGQIADLWVMPLAGGTPRLLVKSASDAVTFSPDGRWVAYTLRETGTVEVYVGRTDGAAGRWKVTNGGGTDPRWNPNGRELFYRQGTRLLAVSVTPGAGLSFGAPQLLFENPKFQLGLIGTNYDVDRDGQRFLAVTEDPASDRSQSLRVLTDWAAKLKP